MTNGILTTWKSLVAASAMLGLLSSAADYAAAQRFVSPTRGGVKVRSRIVITDIPAQPPATRGSGGKVRSRIFNPYDVTSQTRLSIDPFGFFTVAPPAKTSAPLAAAAPASADTEAAPAGPVSSASSSVELSEPGVGESVRPPYRPPVRSPFRPPPRPPF